MPLPTSGQITAEMIRNEFGGGNPFNIRDYYRGGPRVPNTGANAGVPTSGRISFASFYGASASSPLTMSISPTTINRTNLPVGSAQSASVNVTPNGGTGGYTYSSVIISGFGISLTNPNGSTPGGSATGQANGQEYSITVRTTVTDSSGATAQGTWSVQFQWGIPF